ncbi:exopolysaccharide biosynthesis polyprenyl glycosylphosphotransferase [Candidatus Wolfebacteria bacterium]|nr:exopolysaccharide biosynthesis polyprenyl glycosylphosphotransferase [Candidatus Wolfebacteria bacterium]
MKKTKKIIIVLGDIIILYGALILALFLRYGPRNFEQSIFIHIKTFSLIFVIWILVFYLADLYKDKYLRINLATIQVFATTIIISAVCSIILFYLFPAFFKLTPKTNLFIFSLIFGFLDFSWRFILLKIFISKGLKVRVLFLGQSETTKELTNYLNTNPQIGYDIVFQIKEYLKEEKEKIIQTVKEKKINIIVIQGDIKKDKNFIETFYQLLSLKVSFIDLANFYEIIFQKIPLNELEESWFIEKIAGHRRLYDLIKRFIDIGLALFCGIVFSPFILIIAILTKLSSRKGPVIYKQKRVGENNKIFTLLKFGVMKEDKGPLATAKNDNRFTSLGKIFDRTHLNEIPQLYNILKGDISFIGPRAERKELVDIYQQIPYYKIRHTIKPGLTGWAQVNYKPSASLKEAQEKLQYDIFYIKNRSLILDILIFLKTIKYLFISNH